MINKVILAGRLTAAPELRTTSGGTSVCEFTIAVDRRYHNDQTDFINCTVYGKTAENLSRYKRKGDAIGVCGALRNDTYTNKDGEKRSKIYVAVSEIDFLGSRPARDQDNGQIPDAETDNFPF